VTASTSSDASALTLSGISKRFGTVQAVDGVDFTVRAGTLHALLGENGAGKSTLMAIASGLIAPDGGTITRNGIAVQFRSPLAARAAGIGMVHQHSTAIEALTVAENVALAAGWPVSSPRALQVRVREAAERAGLPLDPAARVAELTVALKQRLEIVKALASEATLLLLDEPAAVLTPDEAAELLRLVRAFCARGGSAVLITHKLDEALAHADDLTVLRRGRLQLARPARGATREEVARAMIGDEGGAVLRDVLRAAPPADGAAGASMRRTGDGAPSDTRPVILVLREASVGRLQRASLTLHAGEIVGVAAVEGNGQRELLRLAAGLRAPASGDVQRSGTAAFIPEDRTHEALIGAFSLVENAVLGAPGLGGVRDGWRLGGRVQWRAARSAVQALMTRFDVRAAGPDAAAQSLSGGNQQKLVIGRALAKRPALLVAEQPTRGLDFAATAFVHETLRRAAADGAAVLVHAGDLDEVLSLATRVVVLHGGTLREVPRDADRATIGRLMLGQEN
jgi:simple sugar transport system ATP-binding protein